MPEIDLGKVVGDNAKINGREAITISAGDNITITNTVDGIEISALGGGGGAVDSVNGQTGVVVLDKEDIGLTNVDNTSDLNKPISIATQTALDNLNTSIPTLTSELTNDSDFVVDVDYNHTDNNFTDADKTKLDSLENYVDTVVSDHIDDQTNPHLVTKVQVGLGNVDNTSDANKPISTATQLALNSKQNTLTTGNNISILNNVISSSTPMTTTTIFGGIKAKDRTTETNEVVIDPATGIAYTKAGAGEYTLPIATNVILGGVKGKTKTTETTEVVIDGDGFMFVGAESYVLPTATNSIKGGVIIGDNLTMTGDTLSVNITTVATKEEIDKKADLIDGKILASQLPSFVDDVVEVPDFDRLPAMGETGKIYVALDTNITYRWGGTEYVPIGSDLALGETAETAYRGDRGKIAYDFTLRRDNPSEVTATQVGLGNVNNTSDLDKPLSTATQTALNAKQDTLTAGDGIDITDDVISVENSIISIPSKLIDTLQGIELSEIPLTTNKSVKFTISGYDLIFNDYINIYSNNVLVGTINGVQSFAVQKNVDNTYRVVYKNIVNDTISLQVESNGSIKIDENGNTTPFSIVQIDEGVVITDGTMGVSDYNYLSGKPSINGVVLSENLTTSELLIDIPTLTSELTNDSGFVVDASYVHTDNNFTTAEKTKLAGLENYDDTTILGDINDLEVNKANSIDVYTKTQIDDTLNDYALIVDIPTTTSELTNDSNYAVDANYVHTDNNFTTAEQTKLTDLPTNAELTDTLAEKQEVSSEAIFTSAQVSSGVALGENVDIAVTGEVNNFVITSAGEYGAIQFVAGSAVAFTFPANNAWSGEAPEFTQGLLYTIVYYKGSFVSVGGR